MPASFSVQRVLSVARKEVLHILRDPMTLLFTLFIPILQLFTLGYAIDTNIRHVRTLVLDQARTQESRELLRSFSSSEDFTFVGEVFTDQELTQAIVAGRARVGIKIPEDYSRRLLAGQSAQILILVDGSESSVAGEVVNVSHAIALRESLHQVLGERQLPVDCRPRVLFNPDTRSPNFFIPGLLVNLCQMMAVMLTSTSIVRERENGTLEQLFLTPVRPAEIMVGKLLPYLTLTLLEFCTIVLLMRWIFQVPIHGSFALLLELALPFVLAMLGLGLWISTRVSTREAAMQLTLGTLLPSLFLSGYIFPLDSMPRVFRWIAQLIPTTWMIDASRGVILRGADWQVLSRNAVVLWIMALAILTLSTRRFRKRLV